MWRADFEKDGELLLVSKWKQRSIHTLLYLYFQMMAPRLALILQLKQFRFEVITSSLTIVVYNHIKIQPH